MPPSKKKIDMNQQAPPGPDFSPRRREVDRLADNWKVLLDNMLEMVFLINENNI